MMWLAFQKQKNVKIGTNIKHFSWFYQFSVHKYYTNRLSHSDVLIILFSILLFDIYLHTQNNESIARPCQRPLMDQPLKNKTYTHINRVQIPLCVNTVLETAGVRILNTFVYVRNGKSLIYFWLVLYQHRHLRQQLSVDWLSRLEFILISFLDTYRPGARG